MSTGDRSRRTNSPSAPCRVSRVPLVEATIPQMLEAMESHLLTSEPLVEMYVARIEADDDSGPALNSYLHVNEHAAAEGRQLTKRRRPPTRQPSRPTPSASEDPSRDDVRRAGCDVRLATCECTLVTS